MGFGPDVPKRHLAVLTLGVLIFLPSLWVGFMLDDFFYLGAIEGRYPEHDTRRSLFAFFINDEEAMASIAERGGYPWWIDERVRGETLRPLSDLLFRFDYSVHGRNPFGYHLHSIAWWAAVLAACGIVFRRTLPGAVGVLALLLFAVDEVHVMPVAWIANRNALVALAPVMLGLWAWMRWRENGWPAGRFLAVVGILIGMAGGEVALAGLGYFVAYTLLGGPAMDLRSRLTDLIPLVGIGAVYALVYRLLGYGGAGTGIYHHPVQDPLGFLGAAVTGIPTLLASGIAGFSADFWFTTPSLRTAQVVVGCVAVLGLLAVLRACWPQLDEPHRRGLRWLLAGSALSLIPVAAAFPSDRMLLVPGIGLVAALATVLVQAYRSWRSRRRWSVIAAGGYLAAVHLILAPLFCLFIHTILITTGRRSLELAASPVVVEAGGRETILVFAPDHVVSIYLPHMIEYLAGPPPTSWRPLSIAPFDHRLRRTGPRSLELEVVDDGVMLRSIFEALYRDPRNGLAPGTIVDRGLLRAEIMSANDRGPTRVAFHFDRDLSDPALYFLVWEDGELREADLPAVGEEVFLKRTLGPGGF
jgi:hypothetical protein